MPKDPWISWKIEALPGGSRVIVHPQGEVMAEVDKFGNVRILHMQDGLAEDYEDAPAIPARQLHALLSLIQF